jgi:hypothetical protein
MKRCAELTEPARIFFEMFSASWLLTQMVSGETVIVPHGFQRRVDLDDAARAIGR